MTMNGPDTTGMSHGELRERDVIHDWNRGDGSSSLLDHPVALVDESLRDGVQSPSVVDPPIEDKKRILHLMDALGIQYADIGLPGAGPRAVADVKGTTIVGGAHRVTWPGHGLVFGEVGRVVYDWNGTPDDFDDDYLVFAAGIHQDSMARDLLCELVS